MSPADKRRHQRITINHEFDSVEAFISEYVTNISEGGVFIRSRQPLPLGTRVNLRFTVLNEEIETIEGVGEVVHLRAAGRPDSGMGVVFRELTPESQAVLDRVTAS